MATDLVEVTEHSHDVVLYLAYALADNFTGRPIYARSACYLHKDADALLRKAVALAKPLGLRLKIFDGFRPSEAQWQLWAHTPDATFLAEPWRGSPHSMGAAVDLTLVDAATGAELDMGTGFDDFTPQAFHADTTVSVEAQRNRHLLMGIMTAAGFDHFMNEWWHYQLHRPRGRYPVLSDRAAGTRLMAG